MVRSIDSNRRLLLALCGGALVGARSAWAAPARVAEGAGSFVFEDAKGDPTKHMTVFTYLPRGIDPTTARIVFVMHGHGKDAEGYRDTWIEHADRYGAMIVTPLFDQQQWGGGEYSYSSVEGRNGDIHDASLWSFNVIEHLFDAVQADTGNRTARYLLYGHSEGGQFVHRLVLLLPDARYEKAVAANAGWYTMPTFDVRFPFGLGGSPVDEASLRRSLGRPLTVLLGELDTDPNHKQLNKTARAEAQGATRFERGHAFFQTAQREAASLQSPLAWQLRTVPNAAHQNSKMSRAAAPLLLAS